MEEKLNGCIFVLKMMNYWKNITEFVYNISYNKVSNSIKKKLDCEPIVELWNLIVGTLLNLDCGNLLNVI